MTPRLKSLILAAMIAVPFKALALPPLEENERVRGEFLAAAVGDEIRKNCPTISARIFYVLRRASQLEDYAISLSYSEDDIETMRKDPAAKQRLRDLRDRYLAQNDVVAGDQDSYCRLGMREIENGTLIGSLLYAR